jgi:hypothetical protein
MTHWCEFCNANYVIDHFDDAGHKVGPQWGPEGLSMWKLSEIRRIANDPAESPSRVALLAILNTVEERDADDRDN